MRRPHDKFWVERVEQEQLDVEQLVVVQQNELGLCSRSEVWDLDHVIVIALFLCDGEGGTVEQVEPQLGVLQPVVVDVLLIYNVVASAPSVRVAASSVRLDEQQLVVVQQNEIDLRSRSEVSGLAHMIVIVHDEGGIVEQVELQPVADRLIYVVASAPSVKVTVRVSDQLNETEKQ